MKIFESTLVGLALAKKNKDIAAFCDLKDFGIFDESGETDFKFDCNSKAGKSFSRKRQSLKLFFDSKTDEVEDVKCTVSCKFDKEQTRTIEIRAKMGKSGKCEISSNVSNLRDLCGMGCSDNEILEKMGKTSKRGNCSKNDTGNMVKPGRRCRYECDGENGETLTTGRKLLCICSGTKSVRNCDWVVSKREFRKFLTGDELFVQNSLICVSFAFPYFFGGKKSVKESCDTKSVV